MFFLNVLFNNCIVHGWLPTQVLFKYNNNSHMQEQEREYDWHIKLQTCGGCHKGVQATWTLLI